mgnify:CR=1 FL=1
MTLKALKLVREVCKVNTVLGVSNISFGLPKRPVINAHFYTMAMQQGLTSAIINPFSEEMMNSYYAFCALMNYDENCASYIERYSKTVEEERTVYSGQSDAGRAGDVPGGRNVTADSDRTWIKGRGGTSYERARQRKKSRLRSSRNSFRWRSTMHFFFSAVVNATVSKLF